ncbi:hypothetical protein FDG2_0843 [Candidatus Protofrankia californiensis]|uniref:Winged helix-turn helix domain-containing protein n=1 Tax=Candidatus Protofrankia californiensis TaxID=1839754 RepID=A0A1C3NUG4_9ACTN|nr:hypothetical protein FDG2_0843 [Candidatus Protofrankia californiensis]
MVKEPGSRIPRSSLEDIRLMALSAYDRGMHPKDVAMAFGAGVSTVYGWIRARNEGGPEALKVKVLPGAAPKLSEEQVSRLWRLVAGSDPRQLQFDCALWTREMVRELIRREFGVTYTARGVGNLLRRMGLSPQRPLTRVATGFRRRRPLEDGRVPEDSQGGADRRGFDLLRGRGVRPYRLSFRNHLGAGRSDSDRARNRGP